MLKQTVDQRRTMEIRKYSEMKGNEDTTYENLRNATKVALRGKCIAVNVDIKKEEISQINNNFPLYDTGKIEANQT